MISSGNYIEKKLLIHSNLTGLFIQLFALIVSLTLVEEGNFFDLQFWLIFIAIINLILLPVNIYYITTGKTYRGRSRTVMNPKRITPAKNSIWIGVLDIAIVFYLLSNKLIDHGWNPPLFGFEANLCLLLQTICAGIVILGGAIKKQRVHPSYLSNNV